MGSLNHNLYAINSTGGLTWTYPTSSWIYSSPAIGADGTIYVGSADGNLYAINLNGTLKWTYSTGSVDSSPAIGADGTIYVGSADGNLYAINLNGTLKWKFGTGYSIDSSPAIGLNGTIYVGSSSGYLYAIGVTSTPITPPSPPTNLNISAYNSQVSISWRSVSGATYYNVYDATSSPYIRINSTTSLNVIESGLTNGSTYCFVVTAANAGGESGYSNRVCATPTSPSSPPTNLTATAGNLIATLTWSASSGATSYNIYQSTTSGGAYAEVGSSTSTSAVVGSLSNGTTYYFVVTAVTSSGESGYSNQTSATPVSAPPPTSPPSPPTNLIATAENAMVTLYWSASSGATSYNVYESQSPTGPYNHVGSSTGTFSPVYGLTNGTTYYFVVTAVNSSGESGYSNQATATPSQQRPLVPTGLRVTSNGLGRITLSWNAAAGATSYKGYINANSVAGPYEYSFPTSQTTDTAIIAGGTTYYWVVTAVNSSGESGYSNAVSITLPPTPTSFTATENQGQAVFNWSASAGATSYNVYQVCYPGTYSKNGSFLGNTTLTSFVSNDSPGPNTIYCYAVTAVNANGESLPSVNSACISTCGGFCIYQTCQ